MAMMSLSVPFDVASVEKCFECPVCLEIFKDPRILKCQHQFCLQCLESVATEAVGLLALNSKQIVCPSCRVLTVCQPGQVIQDLPKPVLVNQLQEIISSQVDISGAVTENQLFLSENSVTPNKIDLPCNWCELEEAIIECKSCKVCLCEKCEKEHNKLSSFKEHSVAPLGKSSFCKRHKTKVLSHFCEECNELLCTLCLVKTHEKNHIISSISDSSLKWKTMLQDFAASQNCTFLDQSAIDKVGLLISDVHANFEIARKDIDRWLKEMTKLLQTKCQELQTDLQEREMQQINDLTQYKAVLNEFINSEEYVDNCAKQANLVEYAKYLSEKVTDLELLQEGPSLFESQPFACIPTAPMVVAPTCVNIDGSMNTLIGFVDSVKIKYKQKACWTDNLNSPPKSGTSDCTDAVGEVNSEKKQKIPNILKTPTPGQSSIYANRQIPVPVSPTTLTANLKKIWTLETHSEVYHFTFDEFAANEASGSSDRIFARTRSKEGSLKEYNYHGELLSILGHGIKGLNSLGCICIDSKRNVFLVTCGKSIISLNQQGHQIDEFKSPGGHQCLCGITYCAEEDLYIATDIMSCSVLIINPRGKKVIRSILGNGQWKFRNPSYVSCCPGSNYFAICDVDNHCISIFSTSGRHVKTFGSEGDGNRELRFPSGVCMDECGRTWVCDRGNKRVVLFWADRTGDHFKVVLSDDEFGNWSPVGLAMNYQTGLLGICVSNVFSATQEILIYGE